MRQGILAAGGQGGGQGLNLYISTANVIGWDLSGVAGPQATKTVTDGIWHLVGAECTSGVIQLWVDGITNSVATAMNPNIIPTRTIIGQDFSNLYFNGVIDEVRVYCRVLSSVEMLSLYNGGSGTQRQ